MPQARRVDELFEHYTEPDFQTRFVRCWALRDLLGDCVLPDDWAVPTELSAAVSLSAEGKQWAAWCVENGGDWETAKVVVFTTFARESLFVDIDQTDVDAALACVSKQLRDGTIRIGHPFGRGPDTVFEAEFGEWRDQLSRDETRAFLARTPQGLAQLGEVVFGPLGVLLSSEQRLFDVSRAGAGFYCTDPGCDALHAVSLTTGDSPPSDMQNKLLAELARLNRAYSEWGLYFRRIIFPDEIWERDRFTAGLPGLLANALAESEQRDLLGLLLRQSGVIRTALQENEETREYATDHADSIVEALKLEEVVHCLMVESDNVLVRGIEELQVEGRITVPPTEVRTAKFTRTYLAEGLLDVRPQLSALGVRFLPNGRDSLDQLRAFFRDLYSSPSALEDLEWHLRTVAGESTAERLNAYLLAAEPADIIRTLVLDSPARLRAALELVGPGYYDIPPAGADEELGLIKTLLWKLGLDADTYPDYLARFHDRRHRFAASAPPTDESIPESERDGIRGAGSNLFVALEEVLDATLAFSSWALSFDHFGARRHRFKYNLDEARVHGFGFVNEFSDGTKPGPILDLKGVNTLEPLAGGFGRLAQQLSAVEAEESLYRRDALGIPTWASHSTLEPFPFMHVLPWLDLTPQTRDRIKAMLSAIPGVLTRNDVARVRNQVAHRRADFPSGVEIRQVCEVLGSLVGSLEDAGLAPNVFTRQEVRTDAHGRRVTTLSDYNGREIVLTSPSEIRRCRVPRVGEPQVILRTSVIDGTSEPLRFSVDEDSTYRTMWLGWPTIVQAPAQQLAREDPRRRSVEMTRSEEALEKVGLGD